MDWLRVHRGDAPLVIAFPHGGTDLVGLDEQFVSPWHAQIDTDWWIAELYTFAAGLGATLIATDISRSVIDMNRDPSGASLYPGQATTELCPTTTFDGEPLYRQGKEPGTEEIEARVGLYYRPYHEALSEEISRLRKSEDRVVVYDCHSIRSAIPRLFAGKLPVFNLGSNSGASADPELIERVSSVIAGSGRSHVVDGRFKGGYITRHYGQPQKGIHALQMELACRGYIHESLGPVDEANGPIAFDPVFAAPTRETLRGVLAACLAFAKG